MPVCNSMLLLIIDLDFYYFNGWQIKAQQMEHQNTWHLD